MIAMLEFIKELFGLAKDSRGLVKDVQDEKTKTRSVKNKILSEIEFNMDLILDHYLEKNVPVGKVIEKLKVDELAKAMEDGFDFSKIKKGKIDIEITGDNPFLKKYIGYDCEAFLRKIRHHIGQIKLLPELYNLSEGTPLEGDDKNAEPDEKKVNIRVRLENLAKRYILFTKFLKTGT